MNSLVLAPDMVFMDTSALNKKLLQRQTEMFCNKYGISWV